MFFFLNTKDYLYKRKKKHFAGLKTHQHVIHIPRPITLDKIIVCNTGTGNNLLFKIVLHHHLVGTFT